MKQIIFWTAHKDIEREDDLRSWITTQAVKKESEKVQAGPGVGAWSLRWPDAMLYPLS